MKITSTRRISQIFFFILFIWFCIVNTLGDSFWQLRGWPVNLFLQLDPLTAIATVLSSHTLYAKLLWALLTIVLTIIIGRFFCSWLCPFGSLHHFVSYLAHGNKKTSEKIRLNRYRKTQSIKYIILIIFLIMAAFPLGSRSLQTGLLDPIPLFSRSINLFLLPILDSLTQITAAKRLYEGAWIIMAVFISLTLLNLVIPRFFCRFICPLGAFMGVISRFALFRIGHNENKCHECRRCERSCEGGCEPAGEIHHSECVLCFNCLDDCDHDTISYQTEKSSAGEITAPDISRRAFLTSIGSGVFMIPAVRLSGLTGPNWTHSVIRPPGAIEEKKFFERCLKCGQCMRICPTNVIQPGGLNAGIENLWTPVLNFRTGTSGCQYNCVACGQSCPTAAIRPITLEEKHGKDKFKKRGHIRIGTAFFDRSRCLPWAMNLPCIVCQENCPVSPKAIYTDEYFSPVRNGIHKIKKASGKYIELENANLQTGSYSTGDYYLTFENKKYKILENDSNKIKIAVPFSKGTGQTINIQVRLQRPYMDIKKCTGCGICEHECPVHGLKAVRVSAEGESRSPEKRLILKRNIPGGK